MKKLFKISAALGLISILCGIGAWLGVKHIVTAKAREKAQHIIAQSYDESGTTSDDEKIKSLAKTIHENFQAAYPESDIFLRLRPYVTNRRLPEFLKLEAGVIETLRNTGLCDNTARMMGFVLRQEGYDSVQWNMVNEKFGHAALLITLPENRKVYADPFYGVVAKDASGKLTDAIQAQEKIKVGQNISDVFENLGEDNDGGFYESFKTMLMNAEGENLIIEATIPKISEPLVFGTIDGNSNDVTAAGRKHEMTHYWHYMGHRYNREWIRILKAQQPLTVEITLTENVDPKVVTADPPPQIEGKNLRWDVKAGQEIVFKDGLAKISFKRLNSFIPIDRMAFYPKTDS